MLHIYYLITAKKQCTVNEYWQMRQKTLKNIFLSPSIFYLHLFFFIVNWILICSGSNILCISCQLSNYEIEEKKKSKAGIHVVLFYYSSGSRDGCVILLRTVRFNPKLRVSCSDFIAHQASLDVSTCASAAQNFTSWVVSSGFGR